MIGLALARRLGLEGAELESVHRGGLLHDVGKLGIPVEILDKPGRLSPDEMAIMRQHTAIGARIVEPISAYADVIAAVRITTSTSTAAATGRAEGGGDPADRADLRGRRRLRLALLGAALPRSLDRQRVVDYIVGAAGTQFDPRVVEALLAELPGLPARRWHPSRLRRRRPQRARRRPRPRLRPRWRRKPSSWWVPRDDAGDPSVRGVPAAGGHDPDEGKVRVHA